MHNSNQRYVLQPRSESLFSDFEPDSTPRYGIGVGVACLMLTAVCLFLVGVSGASQTYLNVQGIAVVIGGTLISALVQCSWRDLFDVITVLRRTTEYTSEDVGDRVRLMLTLSREVKESGILALEDLSLKVSDRFLKLGLTAVVDGYQYEDIRKILSNEIEIKEAQTIQAIHTLESMASFAPAMGLIGTIIGLIEMLSVLQTPDAVGPAMALALVSTLYGSLLANVFLFPLAGRLKNRLQKDVMIKRTTLEGLLSIRRLENPQVLEQRMQSFSHIASGE